MHMKVPMTTATIKDLLPEVGLTLGVATDRGLGSNGKFQEDVHLSPQCQLDFHQISTQPCLSPSGFSIMGISGSSAPGQILAIMGPTASGKTTLLNAISGRVPLTQGVVLVNRKPVTRRMLRTRFGYVQQYEAFFSTLSLKETLVYTAMLRLSDKLSNKDKIMKVQEIVDALDLYKCQDTPVGDDLTGLRGLSGGEKKRLSIACELLTDPSVLLVDEPTSGLDSFTAIQLIKTLRHCAVSRGKNIVITVHQPSSKMFRMFDSLLALAGGKTAYFGPANVMPEYMKSLGFGMEDNYNPADFLLERLKYDEKKVVQAWAGSGVNNNFTNFRKTPEPNDNPGTIGEDEGCQLPLIYEECSKPKTGTNSESCEESWQTGFLTQVRVLTHRNVKLAIPRVFSKVNVVQALLLGIMAGLVWFRSGRREQDIDDLQGWMFFSSNYWMLFVLFQALWAFPPEKPVIKKERLAGAYRLSAYYVSKIAGELPLEVTLPSLYFLISYSFIGGSFFSTLGVLLVQLLSSIAAQSVGLALSAIFDNGPATTVASIFTVGAQLIGGYLTKRVPPYLKIFSLVYNGLRNLEIVEYTLGPPFECTKGLESPFPSCRGGSQYVSSEDLLLLGKETDGSLENFFPLWAHTAVLIGFIIVFRIISYVSLKRQV